MSLTWWPCFLREKSIGYAVATWAAGTKCLPIKAELTLKKCLIEVHEIKVHIS